jgi:competence ComEA-like helix-hairpin-helix protein
MLAPHERRLLWILALVLATGAAADWLARRRPREAAWLVGAERVVDLHEAGSTGETPHGEVAAVDSALRAARDETPRRASKKPARRAGVYDAQGRLDLNAADSSEILALTGVGPSLAGRLLAERRRRGRFQSLEQLLDVKGIGPKTLERLRPQLFLRAAKDSLAPGR